MNKIFIVLITCLVAGCTFSQSTTEGDITKTTSMSFNPGDRIWKYVIPVVPTGK